MSGATIYSASAISAACRQLRRWVQSYPLLPMVAMAIAGIVVDRWLCLKIGGRVGWLLVWIAATGALAMTIWVARRSFRHRPAVCSITSLLLIFPVAAAAHRVDEMRYRTTVLHGTSIGDSEPIIAAGVIANAVNLRRHVPYTFRRGPVKQWQSRFELEIESIRSGLHFEPAEGRALVVVDGRCDELKPGDRVRVYGVHSQFKGPTNPGQVDLRPYYRRRHLHFRIDVSHHDQIETSGQSEPRRFSLHRYIHKVAVFGRETLIRHINPSTHGLAIALVIGQRDFVDQKTRDRLLVTGTAHLLSVSGLHLAIVVLLARWLATLLQLPLGLAIAWTLTICIFYMLLTGARPPVVRASVLVATLLLATWLRRPLQSINTLSLAALILIALNPLSVFSLGVHLSFIAAATLLLYGRRRLSESWQIEQALQREQRLDQLVDRSRSPAVRSAQFTRRWLMQLFRLSAIVSIAGAPLVWYHFHVVAPISIVTNVLLGPLLFIALGSGIATISCAVVSQALASVPAWVCDFSLRVMQAAISDAAALPGGHFWLPSPPAMWIVVFYVILGLLQCWPVGSIRSMLWMSRLKYLLLVVWFCVALWLCQRPSSLPEGTCEATFVDVGHGTSVILRIDRNTTWLYDCGRLGNTTGRCQELETALWSLGVTHLNGVVISHADADHFNALPGILQRFTVERIVTPYAMLGEKEPALHPIRAAIEQWQIPVEEVSGGDVIAEGTQRATSEYPIEVLHPGRQRLAGSDNANSLVAAIHVGGTTLLLPGDLEEPGTHRLIANKRPSPGGVMMAPHHGSLQADAEAVIRWARPGETVVSGGRRAERPEVTKLLSQAGGQVHVTSLHGAIRVRIDRSGQLEILRWNEQPW